MSAGRDVVVTAHALVRARARRHFDDGLTDVELAARIVLEVHAGAATGRTSRVKPGWLVLFGRKTRCLPLPAGECFVWDEREQLAWLVRRDGDQDVVVTALHRVVAAVPVAA